MFGLKRHCPICGIDVNKDDNLKRFGKYFCNMEHVEEYVKKIEEQRQMDEEKRKHGHRRGCC